MIYRILELMSYVLDFYLLLISIRIVLSWFGNPIQFSGIQYFMRITDPYLNMFRRIPGLRIGFIDFSALVGIFALVFVSRLLRVYGQGVISLSITVQVIVQTVVGGISSIFSILSILLVIRIVTLFIQRAQVELIAQRFDSFLQPLVSAIAFKIMRSLMPGREASYRTGLWVTFLVFFVGGYIVRLLGAQLIRFVGLIPF